METEVKKKKKRKKRQSKIVQCFKSKWELNPFEFICCLLLAIILDTIHLVFKLIKWVLILGMLVVVLAGGYLMKKYYPVYEQYSEEAKAVVRESNYSTFRLTESSYIYDSDGNIISKLRANSDSVYLNYDEIPEDVFNAFIAVEDRTYWENPGIDVQGIIRVCINAVKTKGEEMHGASTITQQLARNIFLTHEVSFERKAKEILIALELTKKYSKEEILEFYANDICYANAYYGIGAASKAYFNKSVDQLTLSEICYLAAIPNSPSYYDPYKYPERAVIRRDKILGDMLELGYISLREYEKAVSEEIVISSQKIDVHNYETTYAIDCAVRYLMRINGFDFKYSFTSMRDYNEYKDRYQEFYNECSDMLYNGGYKIYTSLNTTKQAELQAILDEGLSFNNTINDSTGVYDLQGAITVVNNETGKVEAIIGGRSQEIEGATYTLNRAFQSPRQPGSSIKPLIVYAPQLERGYTPESIVKNINVTQAKEKGAVVSQLNGEPITLRTALEWSKNGAAWWLFDKLTPAVGLSYLTDMRFSTILPDDYYNSASLGGFTKGVTTVEMANAYSTFVNHGEFVETDCILNMIDKYGKDIYEWQSRKPVYKAKAADTMIDLMKGVITKGTANSIKWYSSSKTEAAAKTGTTNNSKDGWMCGVTPEYSIAVWVGKDEAKPVKGLMGGTYPAKIWKQAMLCMLDGKEPSKFVKAEYTVDDDFTNLDEESGYYSYLPGREDSEILSGDYTVGDYRADRVIGESVDILLGEIRGSSNDAEREALKAQAQVIIGTIYSRNYTAEKQAELDALFDNAEPTEVNEEEIIPLE